MPKNCHVTITKIEQLHMSTGRKIHWFQKCYSFRSRTKSNEVIAGKPFPNSGVTRRLWTLWPSWIDARRQYMFLVIIIITCWWWCQ